jgi:hypothetical protein
MRRASRHAPWFPSRASLERLCARRVDVRYLGIEVYDALEISEQTEI